MDYLSFDAVVYGRLQATFSSCNLKFNGADQFELFAFLEKSIMPL
jgi:hypothetical protein